MCSVLDFMGNHSFLTFLLTLVIGSTIISVVRAIRGHCDDCHCKPQCDKPKVD